MTESESKKINKKQKAKPGALVRTDLVGLTSQTPLGVKMIEDAGKIHNQVSVSVANTLVLAIEAGSRLLAAKSLVPHGQFTELVQKLFCEPNNATLRTAQRYMALAASKEHLIESVRQSVGELSSNQTETELLQMLSTRQAFSAIKHLGLQEHAETDKGASHGSLDDWLIPDALGGAVNRFLGDQIIDVAGAKNFNPVRASRVITLEDDALQSTTTWGPTVWVNPGFKKAPIDLWVQATLDRIRSGEVREALMLLPAKFNCFWSRTLVEFPRGFFIEPLKVSRPSIGKSHVERTELMLVLIAPFDRTAEFASVFSDFVNVFTSFTHGEQK